MHQNVVRGGVAGAPPERKPASPKPIVTQLRKKSRMTVTTRPGRLHHSGPTAFERQDDQTRERACVCVLEIYWRLHVLIDGGTELGGAI